jgi:hypothetical protein
MQIYSSFKVAEDRPLQQHLQVIRILAPPTPPPDAELDRNIAHTMSQIMSQLSAGLARC